MNLLIALNLKESLIGFFLSLCLHSFDRDVTVSTQFQGIPEPLQTVYIFFEKQKLTVSALETDGNTQKGSGNEIEDR